jgi:hypothetical protein
VAFVLNLVLGSLVTSWTTPEVRVASSGLLRHGDDYFASLTVTNRSWNDFGPITLAIPTGLQSSDLIASAPIQLSIQDLPSRPHQDSLLIDRLPARTETILSLKLPDEASASNIDLMPGTQAHVSFTKAGQLQREWIANVIVAISHALFIGLVYLCIYAWYSHLATKWHARLEASDEKTRNNGIRIEQLEERGRDYVKQMSDALNDARRVVAFRNLRYRKAFEAMRKENDFWRKIAYTILTDQDSEFRPARRWLELTRTHLGTQSIADSSKLDQDILDAMLDIERATRQSQIGPDNDADDD